MTRYLISFGAHAMDHIPDEKMPAVAKSWAAKTASACRCAVEVWEFMPDPETDEMLRQADSRR